MQPLVLTSGALQAVAAGVRAQQSSRMLNVTSQQALRPEQATTKRKMNCGASR
jgi:hypothetical protein